MLLWALSLGVIAINDVDFTIVEKVVRHSSRSGPYVENALGSFILARLSWDASLS